MEEKLLSYMEKEKIEAFYIHKPENVRYICGYSGGDVYLLMIPGHWYLLTDPRCMEHAQMECPMYDCIDWRPYGSIMSCIASIAQKENLKSIAFEADCINVAFYRKLREPTSYELLPVEGSVEEFRTIKTESELADIRIACEISSRAFEYLCGQIHPGVTEKELEAKLAAWMQCQGSDVKTSANIVISGAKTSMLHGTPDMKAVEYGDFVLMDYGCKYNGYTADITRTVVVGKATEKQKEVYQYVKEMNEAGIAAACDGVPAENIYLAAYKVIENTEYIPYFYQSIGHGFGLFVHEHPFIRPMGTDILKAGNTMTVEPGIYIPGWGGVRIEDDILITKTGNENLVSAPKDLIELF